jgi:hypothetical protein
MNAMSDSADGFMRAGTRVEVETASGSFRGELTRSFDGRGDLELHCAGHYLRLHRSCLLRVRPLDTSMRQR